MTNSPAFWSILAALVAVGLEYSYRAVPGPWYAHLYYWIPGTLFISWNIHKLVNMPGTPLIGALIIWSFATIFTRTLVSVFVLRDNVAPGVWCALALMILARVVQTTWK